jgi:hypothetical protein
MGALALEADDLALGAVADVGLPSGPEIASIVTFPTPGSEFMGVTEVAGELSARSQGHQIISKA